MELFSNKRSREEPEESPEAKRFQADLLLDILDDDFETEERDPATQDLASVMKIFEEEIALPPPPQPPAAPPDAADPASPPADFDLEYLLEATDDELGLPPTVPSPSDERRDSGEVEPPSGEVVTEAVGLGQIWAFDDAISGFFDGPEFGVRQLDEREAPVAAGDEAVVFDGGLFDYPDPDGLCGPSDFTDISWRSESLPAV